MCLARFGSPATACVDQAEDLSPQSSPFRDAWIGKNVRNKRVSDRVLFPSPAPPEFKHLRQSSGVGVLLSGVRCAPIAPAASNPNQRRTRSRCDADTAPPAAPISQPLHRGRAPPIPRRGMSAAADAWSAWFMHNPALVRGSCSVLARWRAVHRFHQLADVVLDDLRRDLQRFPGTGPRLSRWRCRASSLRLRERWKYLHHF